MIENLLGVVHLLTALATLYTVWLTLRTARKGNKAIEEVKHATNSIMEDRLAEAKAASFAKGQKDEQDKAEK